MKKKLNAIENSKEDRSLILRRGRQTIRRATARLPKALKIPEPARNCQRRVKSAINELREHHGTAALSVLSVHTLRHSGKPCLLEDCVTDAQDRAVHKGCYRTALIEGRESL
jgi:hypothetical protein